MYWVEFKAPAGGIVGLLLHEGEAATCQFDSDASVATPATLPEVHVEANVWGVHVRATGQEPRLLSLVGLEFRGLIVRALAVGEPTVCASSKQDAGSAGPLDVSPGDVEAENGPASLPEAPDAPSRLAPEELDEGVVSTLPRVAAAANGPPSRPNRPAAPLAAAVAIAGCLGFVALAIWLITG